MTGKSPLAGAERAMPGLQLSAWVWVVLALLVLVILAVVIPRVIGSQLTGRIAFSSNRDEPDPASCSDHCNFEIYVMNANQGSQARLTNNAAADIAPTWSPDGTRIAFVSNRDGNNEIYVMND